MALAKFKVLPGNPRCSAHQGAPGFLESFSEGQTDYLEKLVDQGLGRGDPHSPEYHLGILDALRYREKGSALPQRYELGTAQADAYYAGSECGRAVTTVAGRGRRSSPHIRGNPLPRAHSAFWSKQTGTAYRPTCSNPHNGPGRGKPLVLKIVMTLLPVALHERRSACGSEPFWPLHSV